jgi:ribosomal protein L11 methyltransferase
LPARWLQFWFECGAEQVEPAAALLEIAGADSVSVTPVDGPPRFGDGSVAETYWQRSRVTALLSPDVDVDILIACLRNRIGTGRILAHGNAPLEDADWVAAGIAGHTARMFGGRLCVCPSWAEPLPAPFLLTLDPGLAFGTGSHATTALCLEWLAAQDLEDCQVIDYGCGSGVLGLAAARLGARLVESVDIDEQALAATADNARRNGLADRVRVHGPDPAPATPADVLVANILLGPLQDLAARFAALVRPGGRIAMSGLLATQAEECALAYSPWFHLEAPVFRDEWALLEGSRRSG